MLLRLIIILLTVFPITLLAQNQVYFSAYGKFKIEWGNIDSSKITLYEDQIIIDEFSPQNNGKFAFDLSLNHNYMFTFTKPGYVTKKVQFDTHVPVAITSDPEFIPFDDFDFYVTLFKTYPDIDTMFFNQPVGKIQYYEKNNVFDYDKDYAMTVLKRMEEIEKEIRIKHDKEEIRLAKEKKQQKEDQLAENKQTKNKEKEVKKEQTNSKEESITTDKQDDAITINNKKLVPDNNSEPNTINNTDNTEEVLIADNNSIYVTRTAQKKIDDTEKKQLPEINLPETTNTTLENKNNSTQNKTIKNTYDVNGKKTTRTSIVFNKQKYDLIKVEHSWGPKYFFIQYEHRQYQNISEQYYNIMIAKE